MPGIFIIYSSGIVLHLQSMRGVHEQHEQHEQFGDWLENRFLWVPWSINYQQKKFRIFFDQFYNILILLLITFYF